MTLQKCIPNNKPHYYESFQFVNLSAHHSRILAFQDHFCPSALRFVSLSNFIILRNDRRLTLSRVIHSQILSNDLKVLDCTRSTKMHTLHHEKPVTSIAKSTICDRDRHSKTLDCGNIRHGQWQVKLDD